MLRKLYALVSSSCCADNPDSPQHQEVLLPGSLYGMIIKERLDEILNNIRNNIATDVRNGVTVDFNDSESQFCSPRCSLRTFKERYFTKVLSKVNFDVGAKLSNFLATGNLVSPTGLDIQQASGFTIVAEKLNWQRYISHFRCIHRGAFFAELKTTTVRKLLPEAWGPSMICIAVVSADLFWHRFPVPSAYAGWLSLWSSQSSVKNLSYCHHPPRRRAYTFPPSRTWHDPSLRAVNRRSEELMCSTRWAHDRMGSPCHGGTACYQSPDMENGREARSSPGP